MACLYVYDNGQHGLVIVNDNSQYLRCSIAFYLLQLAYLQLLCRKKTNNDGVAEAGGGLQPIHWLTVLWLFIIMCVVLREMTVFVVVVIIIFGVFCCCCCGHYLLIIFIFTFYVMLYLHFCITCIVKRMYFVILSSIMCNKTVVLWYVKAYV